MSAPGEWLLAISLFLNISVCWWVAAYYFEDSTSRFFAGLAAFSVQVALCCWIPSFFNALGPWTYVLTQAPITAAVAIACSKRSGFRRVPQIISLRALNLSIDEWCVLLLIAAASIAGLVTMAVSPIVIGDEVNYNAARAIYQIQSGSVLPQITSAYRQYHFPFQSELTFLTGVLFTGREATGRILFGLGFPVCVLAFTALAWRIGVRSRWLLAGVLLFAFAPQVRFQILAVKQELWLAAYVAGFAYCVYTAHMDRDRRGRYLALAGCLLALAMNTKTTALFLLPVLPLAAVYGPRDRRRSRLVCATAGFAATALAIGLVYHLTWLTIHFGNPAGSAELRALVAAQHSAKMVRVHTARSIMEMIEVPVIPMPRWSEDAAAQLGKLIGASDELQDESAQSEWPGRYEFRNSLAGERFAFAGLAVLFGFVPWTLWLLVDCGRRRFREISPQVWIALCGVLLGAGLVYSMRWQYHSQVPRRFLVAVLPILIAGGLVAWQRWFSKWKFAATLVLALASVNALGQFAIQFYELKKAMQPDRRTPAFLHGRYEQALKLIPRGSTILYFGAANSPDYLLFDSTDGYSRRVVPWGPYPKDVARLSRMIGEHQISHVFADGYGAIDYTCFPPQDQYAWLREELARRNWMEMQTEAGPVFTRMARGDASPGLP